MKLLRQSAKISSFFNNQIKKIAITQYKQLCSSLIKCSLQHSIMSAANISNLSSLKTSQLMSSAIYSANRDHFLNSHSSTHSPRVSQKSLINANPIQLKNKLLEQEYEIKYLHRRVAQLQTQNKNNQSLSDSNYILSQEKEKLQQELEDLKREYQPLNYKEPPLEIDEEKILRSVRRKQIMKENDEIQNIQETVHKIENNIISLKKKIIAYEQNMLNSEMEKTSANSVSPLNPIETQIQIYQQHVENDVQNVEEKKQDVEVEPFEQQQTNEIEDKGPLSEEQNVQQLKPNEQFTDQTIQETQIGAKQLAEHLKNKKKKKCNCCSICKSIFKVLIIMIITAIITTSMFIYFDVNPKDIYFKQVQQPIQNKTNENIQQTKPQKKRK